MEYQANQCPFSYADSLARRSDLDDPSLWQLGGFISGVYSAGNRTLLERERQRVHLATLLGNDTRVLCARIDNDDVSPGEPGTGPPPNRGAHLVPAALWTVMASTMLGILL